MNKEAKHSSQFKLYKQVFDIHILKPITVYCDRETKKNMTLYLNSKKYSRAIFVKYLNVFAA